MSFLQRLPFYRTTALAAFVALVVSARAQFVESGAGSYDYNTTGHWFAGVINAQFDQTLMADQTITFGTYTVLSSGLQFALGGTNKLTLRSDGAGSQTITLLGNLDLGGTADVVIGSNIAAERLSINLDMSPRNFSVATGRTLTVLNSITGSTGAAVNKLGAGTMVVAGSLSYLDATTVWEGTLQFGDGLTNGSLIGGLVVKSGATANFNVVVGTSTISSQISGAGDLTKDGSGTLELTADNSYSGATTIAEGQVADGAPGAYSPNSRVRVANGAILYVNFVEAIAGLSDEGIGPGAVMFTNNAALVVATATGEAFSFAGTISGAGRLLKSDAGTLTLTGTNTQSGGTTINGGTLAIAGDSSLGDGTTALTLNGGTLQLTTTYNSSRPVVLEIGGGTIKTNTFQGTVNGTISGAGSLVHQGTGILTLGGANTYTGGTTVQGGGVLDFTADANLGATTSGVTLNGGDLRTKADVADFTHAILLAGTGAINTYGNSSTFSGLITGSGSLSVKSQLGGGILTLTNSANQWAGNTFLESGTLRVGATNALPTDNVVKVSDGATLDIGADQTLAAVVDVALAEIPAAKVNVAAGKTLTVGRSGNDTFGGVFTGSGVFAKQGAGTLTVGAASDAFTGRIDVVGGTLELSAAGSFTGCLTRIGGGATLKVSGASAVLAALDDYAAGSSGTLLIDGALMLVGAQTTTFSGALTGGGGLTLAGTGELAFAGTSTFTGDVTIQAGTLTVAAVDAFKARTVTVASGATFNVAKSTTISGISSAGTTTVAAGQTLTLDFPQTLSSVISGAGSVAFNNANMMITSTITGDQTYTGDTVVNIGTLEIGAGGSTGTTGSVSGNVRLDHGAVLAFNRATADYSYAGGISGNGAIVKQGAGRLTLTGASTYTGPTVVKNGTLRLATTNALPAATSLSLASGTLLDVLASQIVAAFSDSAGAVVAVSSGQVFNVTLGDATSGTTFAGALQGAGAFRVGPNNGHGQSVTLTGENMFTGGTTIDVDGALQLGNRGATGMVAGDIVNHGVLAFERSNAVTFSGAISGSGKVRQGGPATTGIVDTLTLTGANTYTGGTDVVAGRLRVMNTGGSATGSGTVTVHNSAAFLGNGSIAGGLVVNRGGMVAPALSDTEPATLTVRDTSFLPGGLFAFVIRDAKGVPGTDLGLLRISGALSITATAADPFVISLVSVSGGAAGPAANFDSQQAYSWTLLTSDGITGFSSNVFLVDTAGFANSLSGSFAINTSGGDLFINYSPAAIPEPATWALLATGLVAVTCAGIRRRIPRG